MVRPTLAERIENDDEQDEFDDVVKDEEKPELTWQQARFLYEQYLDKTRGKEESEEESDESESITSSANVECEKTAEELERTKNYQKQLRDIALSRTKKRSRKISLENRVHGDILVQNNQIKLEVPPSTFRKVVKEVMDEHFPDYEIEYGAICVLQPEAEQMVSKMMTLSGVLASHRGRKTVDLKDIQCLKELFEINKDGCPFSV